jgi:hypothetical protein
MCTAPDAANGSPKPPKPPPPAAAAVPAPDAAVATNGPNGSAPAAAAAGCIGGAAGAAAGKLLLLCIGAAAGMLQKSSRGRGALPLLAAGEVVGSGPSSALMSTLGDCRHQTVQHEAAADHELWRGCCIWCGISELTGLGPIDANPGRLQTKQHHGAAAQQSQQ